jgi:hypothetical protein
MISGVKGQRDSSDRYFSPMIAWYVARRPIFDGLEQQQFILSHGLSDACAELSATSNI